MKADQGAERAIEDAEDQVLDRDIAPELEEQEEYFVVNTPLLAATPPANDAIIAYEDLARATENVDLPRELGDVECQRRLQGAEHNNAEVEDAVDEIVHEVATVVQAAPDNNLRKVPSNNFILYILLRRSYTQWLLKPKLAEKMQF